MSLPKSFFNALRVAKIIDDWEDPSFCWKKAFISAAFSQAAYHHIPEFELENINRANLIPCSTYRQALQTGRFQDIQILEKESELPMLIHSSSLFVSVVFKVDQVVFVSLRGTQQLYDWFVNIQVGKMKNPNFPPSRGEQRFHSGFYKAIGREMGKLSDAIVEKFGNTIFVCATGHSLGGALAAILNATKNSWVDSRPFHYRFEEENVFKPKIICCYTFGMPRYGNFNTIVGLPGPYHVYNKNDIVPTVPPRMLGYEDCLNEYCISGNGKIEDTNRKGNSFGQFIFKLLTKKGILEHDIELYVNRIQALAGINSR